MNPYMQMIQKALAALKGGQGGMPTTMPGVGGQSAIKPLDAGAGPMPGGNPMDSPTPGPMQQQNLPGGKTPLPPGGDGPLGGANLAELAKMIHQGNQGPQGAEPQPPMAPMGGAGHAPGPMGPPAATNPPPQPMAPANASAPQAQGPQAIGAFLASPQGKMLLERLRQMQQGGQPQIPGMQ